MPRNSEEEILVPFTKNELVHLLVLMRMDGYREKRDYPKSLRGNRNDEMQIIGRIMKRLRKAYEKG
jgi:hypothetical protein